MLAQYGAPCTDTNGREHTELDTVLCRGQVRVRCCQCFHSTRQFSTVRAASSHPTNRNGWAERVAIHHQRVTARHRHAVASETAGAFFAFASIRDALLMHLCSVIPVCEGECARLCASETHLAAFRLPSPRVKTTCQHPPHVYFYC